MRTSLQLGHSNFLYLEGENTKSNFNCLLTSSNVRSRSSSSSSSSFSFCVFGVWGSSIHPKWMYDVWIGSEPIADLGEDWT